ncbi:uncharacterized protein BYT42DRAFT_542187 [Radiomyces spectabilis]|uniref:uncharacterized protein n=1 Tax=Radiomyces spectabilis TaxID=64574 RepID=UPI0022200F88|nr:uncharacterized protein BYT42DRAFT_542187 [Radiomyces spectabilis]KAI8394008.1 hypothetical protein BYT42DRAFT_542187 [Radiomyces spectabilis]
MAIEFRAKGVPQLAECIDGTDKWEACRIHPHWVAAATTVLWEAPQFPRPQSFRLFLDIIRSKRRLALSVRHLSLCIQPLCPSPTGNWPALTDIIDRHAKMRESTLASPQIILTLARLCEKLEQLTVYGWQLEPVCMEQMASFLPNLHALHIVGYNAEAPPFTLGSKHLTRLQSLRLDGISSLSLQFMNALSTRGQHLKHLHLSLAGMPLAAFSALCNGGLLNLTSVTLTEASHVRDTHIEWLIRASPNLCKIVLCGVRYLTIQTLFSALELCPFLSELEIHAMADAEPLPLTSHRIEEQRTDVASETLNKLVLENFYVSEDDLRYLAFHSTSLRTLALHNCGQPSDRSLGYLLRATSSLYTLHLSRCPRITSAILHLISETLIYKTIQMLHIESCGAINPEHVVHFCTVAAPYGFASLHLVGYDDILQSSLAEFASTKSHSSSLSLARLVMDRRGIQALASNVPNQVAGFQPLPPDRFLTSAQLILLAKQLMLTVPALMKILDSIQFQHLFFLLVFLGADFVGFFLWYNADYDQSKAHHSADSASEDTACSKSKRSTTGTSSTNSIPITPKIHHQDHRGGHVPNMDDEEQMLMFTSSPQSLTQKFGRSASSDSETIDSWGEPESFVPWDKTLGYVADVLEEQRNTVFWQQVNSTQWKQLPTVASTAMPVQDEPPKVIRFSRKQRSNHTWTDKSTTDRGVSSESSCDVDTDDPSNKNIKSRDVNEAKVMEAWHQAHVVDTVKEQMSYASAWAKIATEQHSSTITSRQAKRFSRPVLRKKRSMQKPSFQPMNVKNAAQTQWQHWIADSADGKQNEVVAAALDSTDNESQTELLIDTREIILQKAAPLDITFNSEILEALNSFASIGSFEADKLDPETTIYNDADDEDDGQQQRKRNTLQVPKDECEHLSPATPQPDNIPAIDYEQVQNVQNVQKENHTMAIQEYQIASNIPEKEASASNSASPVGENNICKSQSPAPSKDDTVLPIPKKNDIIEDHLGNSDTRSEKSSSSTVDPSSDTRSEKSSASTAEPSSEEKSETSKSKKIVTLKINTPDHGLQNLTLYEDSPPSENVEKFCTKFDLQDAYDTILAQATELYTKHSTARILKMSKKKKKSKTAKKAF